MLNKELCLVGKASHHFMQRFDDFPKDIRERLSNHRYNLCVCCLAIRGGTHKAIDEMELQCIEAGLL